MEPTSIVHQVPPRKTLREGQQRVVDAAISTPSGVLSVQLPTGYGKTLAAAATFAALRESGRVNRLLYIVSTDAQRRQFVQDAANDFLDAGLAGIRPFDISYSPILAHKEHVTDRSCVFMATIQALASGSLMGPVRNMLGTGRWMIVVDEHHHYAIDQRWGRAILDLNFQFLLAASATPYRKDCNGAFGPPKVIFTYLEALEEKAVKELVLHSFEYRVDAIAINGQVHTFTTSELHNEVGSSNPDAIDLFMVSRKLRWSPKYISPLVSIPIERLLSRRCATGLPLQMIVGAMGCQHAQMVCEQIKSMFGDTLRVDWVGTGPSGRLDEANRVVLRQFCPPKIDGLRRPEDVELDVLVHVGMAGEGLDAVHVSEIVHLNPATINNQNDQENGRAARRLPGVVKNSQQKAFISVDSSSPYAEWTGTKIMSLFDAEQNAKPPDKDPIQETSQDDGYYPLPDVPMVYIAHCELTHIDRGDPEVRLWAKHIAAAAGFDGYAIVDDPAHPGHEPVMSRALQMRREELLSRAHGMDRMSILSQLKNDINLAIGKVALLAARTSVNGRFERSLIGDMKKRIYGGMLRQFREPVTEADEDGLRERYSWVKAVETSLLAKEIPPWLR